MNNSHLLDICNRILPLLDNEFKKGIKYEASLLGDGNHSVLRTKGIVFFNSVYYDDILQELLLLHEMEYGLE